MAEENRQTSAALETVALAYEAALEPARMPELIQSLTRLTGAEASIWIESDGTAQQAVSIARIGLNDAMMEDYARLAWSSPLVPELMKAGPGVAVTDRMLLERRIFERSDFYQDWVRPMGLEEGLIASLAPLRQDSVVMTFMRHSSNRLGWAEGAPDFERFRQVLPYIGRAAVLRAQLHRQAGAPPAGAAVALDALRIGVLAVDAQARLLWANAQGQALLRQADGLSSLGEGLRADDAASTQALHALCRRASGALRLPRASGRAAFSVIAMPARPAGPRFGALPEGGGGARALLFVNDPEQTLQAEMPLSEEQGVERLRGLYGLTRVEARVALLMACGLGLPEVAARFDLAPSTVRTHAKQIFQKLDVHSQARVTNLLTQLAMIRA